MRRRMVGIPIASPIINSILNGSAEARRIELKY